MSKVGNLEIVTQNRIIDLFQNHLHYSYLGNFQDRINNSNIETEKLKTFFKKKNYSDALINRALRELDNAKIISDGRSLYDANKDIYRLLRYGIKVKEESGKQNQTIWLIDWDNPQNNDFAIASEVTLKGNKERRPDLVIYINGIAIAVIELKRSIVSIGEGIRQNISNQRREFNRDFFSTIQLVMAGNDSEGLRYGTIETKEKYYLEWKEKAESHNYKLDQHLSLIFQKQRLLELIHNFVIFDSGIKKICRHNQYFGIKEAQKFIKCRQGGIIWHTQGSGKSLTMVWLSKWIRENIKNSRILIITDRCELDEQIEIVYNGVDEDIYRTTSGSDLVNVLNGTEKWLICSLVHKFGSSKKDDISDEDIDKYMAEIQKNMMSNFEAKGDIYVFVDECHRTQSGKLHSAMKKILPNAVFIGFTGTPLLKEDKQTSLEIFGPYIHSYKFDEAVKDKVILDLCYEARDIDQNITSHQKIDLWFEAKTKGLSDYGKAQLKKKWGTIQKVFSSRSRLEKIVADILLDMETKERLANGRGNAILVSGSIYQACKFYELFDKTNLSGKCAIITSYKPSNSDIKNEESGEGYTEKLCQYDIYRKMLADFFDDLPDAAINRASEFEEKVKNKFKKQPGQMRLLIVVDKLLTGFDAPSATYLYIDKKMQDHGLFQAICRVNRLDGDDKEYGYIVDYKDLFNSLENSIKEYTSGAFDGYDKNDVTGLLEDSLSKGKQRLDETREAIKALCEDVYAPKDTPAYIKYFCGEAINKDSIKNNEAKRVALYKTVASFIRAYAVIADKMIEAGYSNKEITEIKNEIWHFEKVREEIKKASGDYIDMKSYEPAMRHLIDSYVRAEESQTISSFEDTTLVELIVKKGEDAINELPKGIKSNREAVAETIENNIRKVIIEQQPINPKYYDNMSDLLDSLIKQRKENAVNYQDYLNQVIDISNKIYKPESGSSYPNSLDSGAKRAIFDNLGKDESLALEVDRIIKNTKKDNWRGNNFKERELKNALKKIVNENDIENIFEIIKQQNEY
jgi:type I restriction enzyme R subunit